ncbi:MAG: DUF1828 domain-containing protein [Candidatus Poribacteria bacterium]|nr:DUF1828 domain-containing protein [Candidatus Poribacteria bacterium]
MTLKNIEKNFIEKFSSKIRIVPDGKGRFRVFTPFRFDDGDHLAIVLKNENGQWVLSDEGHTYMHLTYEIDETELHSGIRHKIISGALSMFEVKDRDGELILEIQGEDYGIALYSFAQSLLRIGDVSYVSLLGEKRSQQIFGDAIHGSRDASHQQTFRRIVRGVLEENVPIGSMESNWKHPNDPKGAYKVDYRINGVPKPPLLVHVLSGDTKMRDATIALHQFEKWKMDFMSLGITKDANPKPQKVLDCFLDAGGTYCNLAESPSRIQEYLS